MTRRRTLLTTTGAVVPMMLLAGCGGSSVAVQGQELKDPEQALTKAEQEWRSGIRSVTDDDTATVSKDSRCYFRETGEDEVGNHIYCGPIRRLGVPTDHAWDVLSFKVAVSQEGEGTVRLAGATKRHQAVDLDNLFRPGGEDPVEAASLDKPKAPRASVSDFAAMVAAGELDLKAKFTAFEDEPKLITPSAAITVTAKADLSVLPKSVASLSSGANGKKKGASYFRPAAGQHVTAWRVTIGPGPDKPEANLSEDSWGSDTEGARDASTTFAVRAGGQRLVVHGASPESDGSFYGSDSEQESFAISCEVLPCSGSGTNQYTLIASTSADESSLVVTVDGADQTLSLSDGERSSEVSTVEYSRRRVTQQVSTTWPTETVTVSFGEYDENELKYGGQIDSVYLTAFDFRSGWAPKGKAWLEIPMQNDPAAERYSDDWSLDSNSWKLKTEDKTYTPKRNAGADGTVVFLVPDDFTAGTFVYRPTGAAKGYDDDFNDVTKPFTAKKPLKLKISLPEDGQ